jgi:glycosyltransferase involved in cell wall biosynthesis
VSIFITQLVPRDEVPAIKGAAQASINFCLNFIEAIQPEQVYALLLISEKKRHNFSFEYPKVSFIQCRFFPHLKGIRVFNAIIENIIIVKRILYSRQNNIWFYNINGHNILAFFILKFLCKKKCYIILADFSLEALINKISLRLMQRADGIVAFSAKSRDLFLKHKNFISKAGIINLLNLPTKEKTSESNKTFLFSGSLDEHAGIELALKVFSDLPDLTLIITGKGKGEALVKEYTQNHNNIKYLGFLNFVEYLSVLNEVEVVLSLRDPSFAENDFNFPSKIIEFLFYEKIIISTIQYTSIEQSLYFYSVYSKKDVIDKIYKIMRLESSELSIIKVKGREFVINNFSYQVWKNLVTNIEKNDRNDQLVK